MIMGMSDDIVVKYTVYCKVCKDPEDTEDITTIKSKQAFIIHLKTRGWRYVDHFGMHGWLCNSCRDRPPMVGTPYKSH